MLQLLRYHFRKQKWLARLKKRKLKTVKTALEPAKAAKEEPRKAMKSGTDLKSGLHFHS